MRKYILAELRLNSEIQDKEMKAEEIFGTLDESLKSQIALADFIDFLDKLHISGNATLGRENCYKINRKFEFNNYFLLVCALRTV